MISKSNEKTEIKVDQETDQTSLKKTTDDDDITSHDSCDNIDQKNIKIQQEIVDDNIDQKNIKINRETIEAQQKAKENFDRMLRIQAEFENYKKRTSKKLDDLRKYAIESIMRELLSIVDNLERAIESSNDNKKNISSITEGITLTLNEMIKLLEKHKVMPLKSINKPFDPRFHQAMSQKETLDHPPNIVISEFLKGYMIHERLLRPAMVTVSKELKKIKDEKITLNNKSSSESDTKNLVSN